MQRPLEITRAELEPMLSRALDTALKDARELAASGALGDLEAPELTPGAWDVAIAYRPEHGAWMVQVVRRAAGGAADDVDVRVVDRSEMLSSAQLRALDRPWRQGSANFILAELLGHRSRDVRLRLYEGPPAA